LKGEAGFSYLDGIRSTLRKMATTKIVGRRLDVMVFSSFFQPPFLFYFFLFYFIGFLFTVYTKVLWFKNQVLDAAGSNSLIHRVQLEL